MTMLVMNQIAGQLDRLASLMEQIRDAQITAVYVLGNVVELPIPSGPSPHAPAHEQTYRAALELLGALGAPIYLIPGEHDPALATINHLVQTYAGPARIHLVHRTAAACGATDVVAGFGGRLTQDHERPDTAMHVPTWEARVAFEHLRAYNELFRNAQRRIFLFAMLPQRARLDHQTGAGHSVAFLPSLIHAYQPTVVCCGAPDGTPGVETISGTRIVNPGWLSDGSYALIDRDRLTVRLGRIGALSTVEAVPRTG